MPSPFPLFLTFDRSNTSSSKKFPVVAVSCGHDARVSVTPITIRPADLAASPRLQQRVHGSLNEPSGSGQPQLHRATGIDFTLTCQCAMGSVPTVTSATYRFIVCALAVLFLGLMTLHLAGPWQYRHEDNGAWFSAIARTHLRAGLSATRGQDFFQERATGQLKPYLHHPPLLGLYLAGVSNSLDRIPEPLHERQ
jgi:hypothetical protein